ncbi:GNAT family N-acetyltransferase, partial [Acinetobacter baumannii]
ELSLKGSPSSNVLSLHKIVVPEAMRNQGNGTKAMQDIISYADSQNKTIALTPSSDFGGNKSRLTSFYKKLGFVENKGRNKDYEISESMYRSP